MSTIQLILKCSSLPAVTITVNGTEVAYDIVCDTYNNAKITFDTELEKENHIQLRVTEMNGSVNLIEIIADDVRFGLVTFLCTTVDHTQNTEIQDPGVIDIEISAPVWKFWCDKMSEFNYERYPLGSIA